MKTGKIYSGLVMTAAVLLCLAGCKKDEEGEKIMLGTQFEKAVSAQKTYLDDDNTVCWSEGDKVNVNGTECEVGDGYVEVEESKTGYAAVYPATGTLNGVGNACTGGSVVIPATQEYNGAVLNGPMAARLDSKSGKLYFRNLYSLLKVTVAADDKAFTVNSITVTATGDNAKALAGTQSFKFNGATNTVENLELTDLTNSSTTVTLNCGSTTVNANNDKDFYLVVHPLTTAQQLTVKVVGLQEGKVVIYTYHTASERKLNRNSIGGLAVNLQQLMVEGVGIGRFKIGENKYVTFSPGNLQYQASSTTWRFAEHQWDYVGNGTTGTVSGSNNADISSTYTGWIDLFGWGTSGWDNGNTYYRPYDYENSGESESPHGRGYGPTNHSSWNFGLTGVYANSDWGVYNAIYNPQTGKTDVAGTWRTLTSDEWAYLLGTSDNTRGGVNSEWWIFNTVTIKATDGTHDVVGLLIYPDGVTAAEMPLLSASLTQNGKGATAITKADFEKLEALGCVLLPIAGYRDGKSLNNLVEADFAGFYWSSSASPTEEGEAKNDYNAYALVFGKTWVNTGKDAHVRFGGRSVRLVKDL